MQHPRFHFGCARSDYARRRHPRVLLSAADIPALRQRVRAGTSRKLMQALRVQVAPLIERVHQTQDLPEILAQWNLTWTQPGTAVIQQLHAIAFVGALDDNTAAVEAVRRVLVALPAAEKQRGRSEKVYVQGFAHGFGSQAALAYDLLHASLRPEDRRVFCDWVVDFGVRSALAHLRQTYFRCAGGNIPMGRLVSGLMGLLAVEGEEGVPDLRDEREQMVLMFEASLNSAIGPNGYPAEDIGYGTSTGGSLAYVVEAVRRAGLFDAYSQCPRFAKFGRAILHFVQPWGMNLSNTGDHGDDFGGRGFVLSRLAAEQRDPVLLWLLRTLSYSVEVPLGRGMQAPVDVGTLLTFDDRVKPRHPAQSKIPTQFMDPARGIVSFRSGWRADDTLVTFDGAHRPSGAQGHEHDSSGHFSLSALGEYFAIDTGRYNIEQSCHNVVLIDGKSGRSTNGEWRMSYYHGNLITYAPGKFCDYAVVDSSHQHNCYWARRHLGLVKGSDAPSYAWTVEDINKANDWAEFWWQLHTSPENVITLRNQSATIQGWRHGNQLDVHFALPAADAYPKAHTLTLAQDEGRPSSFYPDEAALKADMKKFARPSDMVHHRVLLRPRLLAKVGGYNGRFMSVMIPRRNGEQPVSVERLPSLDNSLAVQITFAKVVDTLIFAYEHNLLEAVDVKARGQWCVVRRSRRTGRVIERTGL